MTSPPSSPDNPRLARLNEFDAVFNGNRRELDALYEKALKDDPSLEGMLWLEVTVASSGEITQCGVATDPFVLRVFNDIKDTALQEKIVARVASFILCPGAR